MDNAVLRDMIRYLLGYTFLLCSCGMFTDFRTVKVSLPQNQPPWFTDDTNRTGKVIYPGKSGQIESSTIEWDDSFRILVEKGSSVPIACFPSGNLKPAGAFLSIDSENGKEFKLDWKNGFLADLLLKMMKKGIPVEHINIQRLSEEIENKCVGDPWSINREMLEDAIIFNTLSVYKIRQGGLKDIILQIEGYWVPDNPFYPAASSNSQGELILEKIYQGMHKFRNPETKELLDILVGNDGYEYLLH